MSQGSGIVKTDIDNRRRKREYTVIKIILVLHQYVCMYSMYYVRREMDYKKVALGLVCTVCIWTHLISVRIYDCCEEFFIK